MSVLETGIRYVLECIFVSFLLIYKIKTVDLVSVGSREVINQGNPPTPKTMRRGYLEP